LGSFQSHEKVYSAGAAISKGRWLAKMASHCTIKTLQLYWVPHGVLI